MGDLQAAQRVPDAIPGNLEVPRPFSLGLIRMDVDMTTEVLPIQLVGTARAGTLVGQAPWLEPAVHAGLPYLKPPSRFGLAATTTHKIHHPLTQVD